MGWGWLSPVAAAARPHRLSLPSRPQVGEAAPQTAARECRYISSKSVTTYGWPTPRKISLMLALRIAMGASTLMNDIVVNFFTKHTLILQLCQQENMHYDWQMKCLVLVSYCCMFDLTSFVHHKRMSAMSSVRSDEWCVESHIQNSVLH